MTFRPKGEPAATHEISSGISTEPRSGTKRAQVLEAIAQFGARGATTDEVQRALDGIHQTISATVNSLKNDGLIVDSGAQRPTRTGAPAAVWVLARQAHRAPDQPSIFDTGALDDDMPAITRRSGRFVISHRGTTLEVADDIATPLKVSTKSFRGTIPNFTDRATLSTSLRDRALDASARRGLLASAVAALQADVAASWRLLATSA